MDDYNFRVSDSACSEMEAYRKSKETDVLTIFFCDQVDFTEQQVRLGSEAARDFTLRYQEIVREVLKDSKSEGREISTEGDSFLCVFASPSRGVGFALALQRKLHDERIANVEILRIRAGLHLGEVRLNEDAQTSVDLYGLHLSTASRVMGLAGGNQILITTGVLDSAKDLLKGTIAPGLNPTSWVRHGLYLFKGMVEPVLIWEVGESDIAPLKAPLSSDKARRLNEPIPRARRVAYALAGAAFASAVAVIILAFGLFDVQLEMQSTILGKGVAEDNYTPVRDGGALQTGDTYFLSTQTGTDGYLYAIRKESSGKTSLLYPSPSGSAESSAVNPISAGVEIQIPAPSEPTIVLTPDTIGEHTIYWILSDSAWDEFENIETVDPVVMHSITNLLEAHIQTDGIQSRTPNAPIDQSIRKVAVRDIYKKIHYIVEKRTFIQLARP